VSRANASRFHIRAGNRIGIWTALALAFAAFVPGAFAQVQFQIQIRPNINIPPTQILPPATRPATRPTQLISPSRSSIREWVNQLADADPEIRQTATVNLMNTLRRADLPALRDQALSQMPLIPEQYVRLHEIVVQVFLADEDYVAIDKGFLGLSWNTVLADQQSPEIYEGLIVADRIPGFSSNVMLQRGDIVVGRVDPPFGPIHFVADLVAAVSDFPPGGTVTLDVLRNGKRLHVPLLLEPRPEDLVTSPDPASQAEWMSIRQDKAEDYWRSHFPEFAAMYRGPDPNRPNVGSL
jgi:hypothetical protein